MSLFASLGQGDIWALNGISFASPVNDLLEKGDFTLEELLEEDELIQEVKSKNERLIEFLSKEKTIDRLLDFIIYPAGPEDNALRTYKYPYMSCEVLCCETPEILNNLVEQFDGLYLDKLFSLLSSEHKLDHYLAGYFEKTLEMLFRRMTVSMMKYLNSAGTDLLKHFLDHIDSYSIMQIVQRLMLPHIPFTNLMELDSPETEENKELYQCNWSFSREACGLLFNRMFDSSNTDVPLHISDLLVTVLQLSSPESLITTHLCEEENLKRLIDACVLPDADMEEVDSLFSQDGSVSLAAVSVLESLVSRLFESSLPFEQNLNNNESENEQENEQIMYSKRLIERVSPLLFGALKDINSVLQRFLVSNPCKPLQSQGKINVERIGHRGVLLIKSVEAIFRLSTSDYDEVIYNSGILKTCIDLMFFYENNSLLHLSVQRIIITILEGDSLERSQKYLLLECGLIQLVMNKTISYDVSNSVATKRVNKTSHKQVGNDSNEPDFTEEDGKPSGEGENPDSLEKSNPEKEGNPCKIVSRHSSVIGNLVLVAQALSVALDFETPNMNNDKNKFRDLEGGDNDSEDSFPVNDKNNEAANSRSAENSNRSSSYDSSNMETNEVLGKVANLRSLVNDIYLLREWDLFVDNKLRAILDHQIVGSYQAPPIISNQGSPIQSGEDPLNLGVDLDLLHLETKNNKNFGSNIEDNLFENGNDDVWWNSETISAQSLNFGTGLFDSDQDVVSISGNNNNSFDNAFLNKDLGDADPGSMAFTGFADFASFDAPAVTNNPASTDFAFNGFADFSNDSLPEQGEAADQESSAMDPED